ncbi:transcription factor TFIID complex subunit 8 C-term-domain-containing protein [Kalaharituber pfeilii]|nr:transcription factor TFIID complex subunit 8 C-term-domain-containing protein [Kalaharituber pfeilii]
MAFTERPVKRRRREPVPDAPRPPETAAVVSEELAASLLDRANAKILQSVGFTGATRVAQERLRMLAEEYYLSMLERVARFAHAQRRTRPTVVDFQQMLIQSGITISSLLDETRRVPSTQPVPLDLPGPQSAEELEMSSQLNTLRGLLGAELDGASDSRPYIPDHLPPFPSKHTYLSTPVFTERPREPRVIREMATQEALLAENALRKILAAAASASTRRTANRVVIEGGESDRGALSTSPTVIKRKNRDEVWEQAFNAVKASEEVEAKMVNGVGGADLTVNKAAGKSKDAGHGVDSNVWLEVTVNSDRQYWRSGGGKAMKTRQP